MCVGRNLCIYQIIYNAVLRARDAVFEGVRPGADWRGLHILANRYKIGNIGNKGNIVDIVEVIL